MPLRIRQGARAIIIDPDHNLLLAHFDFVDVELPTGLWACPGGGIDPGESVRDGLIRELVEETGLLIDDPGEPVWLKEHHRPMSRWDGQYDTFFLLEVEHFEPRPSIGFEQLRAEHVDAIEWWSYDALQKAQAAYDAGDRDDPAFATFAPRQLGHHVATLLDNGRPAQPIEVSGAGDAGDSSPS
jgi:8-oxo-dGTP diphosphatase